MKPILKYFLSFLISFFAASALLAQNNIDHCSDYLTSGFVSDGQEYKAKLDENNRAKFYTTFYGGSQYRLIACGEINDYPLVFSVFDTEKNLLFSNKDNDYTPYWNFTFTSTIDCIIEFEYNIEKPLKNEVMLLIGFKEK